MSRRKLKTERELVADIKKRFELECSKYECKENKCPYYSEDCMLTYLSCLTTKVKQYAEEVENGTVYINKHDEKMKAREELSKRGD